MATSNAHMYDTIIECSHFWQILELPQYYNFILRLMMGIYIGYVMGELRSIASFIKEKIFFFS